MAIAKWVLPPEPVEGAGSAYQHAVALLGDEAAAGEIANERFVDRRVLECEVLDVLGERQLGDGELVLDRARLRLRDLGVQEIAEEAQDLAQPLRPFDGFVEYAKRVSPTCLVHLERNRYSVPASFANRPVSVRVYPERVGDDDGGNDGATREQSANGTRTHFTDFSPIFARFGGISAELSPYVPA